MSRPLLPSGLGIGLTPHQPRLTPGPSTRKSPTKTQIPHPQALSSPQTACDIPDARRSNTRWPNDHPNTSYPGNIGLRSLKGLDSEALRCAEVGDDMVVVEAGVPHQYHVAGRLSLDPMTPGGGSLPCTHPTGSIRSRKMPSHDTIPNLAARSSGNGAEFKTLLGNTNAKLKSGATISSPTKQRPLPRSQKIRKERSSQEHTIALEQAKSKARVEVDIVLESSTIVQGGALAGHVKIHIRRRSKKESPVSLSDGKLRLIGFETIPQSEDSHTFFHYVTTLSNVTQAPQSLWVSPPDNEGYSQAAEGVHILPFQMRLPRDGISGCAKGPFLLSSGVVVRYIAMISVKVKDSVSGKRSIAHFYRTCEVWPRLDLRSVLAPAPRPIQASTVKGFAVLGGGDGKVKLSATLHRLCWIAGQSCQVKIQVDNDTKKTVRSLMLTLIRTTTIFKPRPALDIGSEDSVDPDACQTSTTHKTVAESILEMGQRGTRGHASAKGWWTGVTPHQELNFYHSILLPPNTLSITRGRLLEVEYSIRVTISAGSLSSDVFVTLPIHIINFISIDPLPWTTPASELHELSLCRGNETTTSSLRSTTHPISSNPPAPLHGPHCASRNSLGSIDSMNNYSGNLVPRNLHITNPDPPAASGCLPLSYSDASVYSTDASDDHKSDSDSSEDSLVRSALERRLGNLDLAPGDSGDSDAEVDIAIGTARLDQQEWPRGSDFESTGSFEMVSLDSDSDELYKASQVGPSRTYREPDRVENIGLTSFALRVQEKLIASDKLPTAGWRNQAAVYEHLAIEETEEATPRLSYHPPVSTASGTWDHDVPVHASRSYPKSSAAVKGPRVSRMLPKPPAFPIEPSNPTISISSSTSQSRSIPSATSVDSTCLSGLPSRSHTAPGHNFARPPSLEAVGSRSDGGVRGRVAAFEAKLRTAHESGDAYV